MTDSEILIPAVIWTLTLVGGFFSLRGALRRRRERRRGDAPRKDLSPHD